MKAIKIVGELLVPSLTGNGGKSREQRGTNARRVYSPEVNIFSVLSAIESFVFPSHRPYRPCSFLPEPRGRREATGQRHRITRINCRSRPIFSRSFHIKYIRKDISILASKHAQIVSTFPRVGTRTTPYLQRNSAYVLDRILDDTGGKNIPWALYVDFLPGKVGRKTKFSSRTVERDRAVSRGCDNSC